MSTVEKRFDSEGGFGLVEALLASVILAFGLLAVAGLSVSTASQGNISQWQTNQALAGQSALTKAYQAGFSGISGGTDTITVGPHKFSVTTQVTDISSRVKEVQAQVSGVGRLNTRIFTTRLYKPRQLPSK